MAINEATARLLMLECAARPFKGSVLQLGKQAISFDMRRIVSWALDHGCNVKSRQQEIKADSWRDDAAVPGQDKHFFRLCGFDEVLSCDVSSYEGADIVCDLNSAVSPKLHERFDVIVNGGTLEHVFDVRQALANVHAMLKVNGRVIHIAPSSNLVDHGFYSFSPTLFWDYYEANKYSILVSYLFECYDWTMPWSVYKYSPGCLDDRWGRIATPKKTGVFLVAQKHEHSTCGAPVSQSYYKRLWGQQQSNAPNHNGNMSAIKWYIKNNFPQLTEVLYWARSAMLRERVSHRKEMPPLVGKF